MDQARALFKNRQVLPWDETISVLDEILRESMRIELRRLRNEVGNTLVVNSRDREELLVISDRTAISPDGSMLQRGRPQAICEYPAHQLVGDLIGVSNFLRGRIVGCGLAKYEGEFIRGAATDSFRIGDGAVASIWPEQVNIVPADAAKNQPSGTVEAIAYRGKDMATHFGALSPAKPFVPSIGQSLDGNR